MKTAAIRYSRKVTFQDGNRSSSGNRTCITYELPSGAEHTRPLTPLRWSLEGQFRSTRPGGSRNTPPINPKPYHTIVGNTKKLLEVTQTSEILIRRRNRRGEGLHQPCPTPGNSFANALILNV